MTVYQIPSEAVQLDVDDLESCEDRIYAVVELYRERDAQIVRERLLPALTAVRRLEALCERGGIDGVTAMHVARLIHRNLQGAVDRLRGEGLL